MILVLSLTLLLPLKILHANMTAVKKLVFPDGENTGFYDIIFILSHVLYSSQNEKE